MAFPGIKFQNVDQLCASESFGLKSTLENRFRAFTGRGSDGQFLDIGFVLSQGNRLDSNVDNSSFSALLNQPRLNHERFSAHRELESLLKKSLRGDVCFDLV